jgi:p-hydroxybenzoate 3-monooxygenase
VACDFIAGCDGFHGVSRGAAPGLTAYERGSSSGWLGILAEAPAVSPELIYARHARGFALSSMRTPEISRLYLQAPADADLADWPDARIWDELAVRLGVPLTQGPILERGITPLRSFVVEPMQHGRLFLAGDAAHVVPPTGAKGLNLAVADVRRLAAALTAWFHDHDRRLLDGYSAACLRRVWQVQHFSWWMTTMLHRPDGDDPFAERLQLGQLLAVTSQPAAAASFAANYVGLPYEPAEAGHADTGHADAGDADAGHARPRSTDGSPMDGGPTDRGQADASPRGAARA